VSATSIFFESLPYSIHADTGLIDYERLEDLAQTFKPALIIAGGSAYPREWDYARFRSIADSVGALLMVDMAHISGLVAAQEAADPFAFADVVTTTTHKSLRGPRAGMIFVRRDARGLDKRIDHAVFPSLQGGPHEHQIGAIATQLKDVLSPSFKDYAVQVKRNAKALAQGLVDRGYALATGGTDNHLMLWDVRPLGLTGGKVEKVCDAACITVNKNSMRGDLSAVAPGGVRLGSPALTTRGLKETDFAQIAEFLHRAAQIAAKIEREERSKRGNEGVAVPLTDFVSVLKSHPPEVVALRHEVNTFATSFAMPGFDVATMKYKQFDVGFE
jgi:glycine hydroxymethyltransferase